MRLTAYQQNIIKQTFRQHFESGVIKLFGSRVDETLKGGDIDLFLEFDTIIPNLYQKVIHFNVGLQVKLGEQKIDIITYQSGEEMTAIQREALKTGILFE